MPPNTSISLPSPPPLHGMDGRRPAGWRDICLKWNRRPVVLTCLAFLPFCVRTWRARPRAAVVDMGYGHGLSHSFVPLEKEL